ncbi:MAG: type II 3-dehydroquinate dehydratase [Pyramidobacter sp.]|nr:type II 3-dehydroquinate dehydratase [Pyramidobacter sp.]
MNILVINGPNMNMLGVREPEIYGRQTLADLENMIRAHCQSAGISAQFFQSNHEGAIVDRIQEAWREKIDGIVINPAAYTHTSVAIADALRAVGIPAVEVHISDIQSREDFRHRSFTEEACIAQIAGRGFAGYCDAVDLLLQRAAPAK